MVKIEPATQSVVIIMMISMRGNAFFRLLFLFLNIDADFFDFSDERLKRFLSFFRHFNSLFVYITKK